MKTIQKSIAMIALLVVIIATGCKQNYPTGEKNRKSDARPVAVVPVAVSTQPIPVESSGVLASKASAKLSFKIGGVIQSILVDEGQQVKKGQLLAQLNPSEINAQVVQAQQGVEKAERDLARIERLYKEEAATLVQLKDLTTALEVARANLEIAEFNRQYAKIVAPMDGRIMKRMAEPEELTGPGTPIFMIGNTGGGAYVIRIGVADRDVVRLNQNDTATIRFDAFPGKTFGATVTEIAEAANPATGTFEIELTLESTRHRLRNGFVGKVMITPSRQEAYYKIPMNALIEGSHHEARVFVPDGEDKAKSIVVRPDYVGDDYFIVMQEEAPDIRQVITDGAAYLHEGASIKIVQL